MHDVPVSEEVFQRQGQGGVLAHLEDRTPGRSLQAEGSVGAVRHLERQLIQDVHLICRDTGKTDQVIALPPRLLLSEAGEHGFAG